MENETYWETAFQIWFANDRPSVVRLYDLLPPLPDGEKPGAPMIKTMVERYGWNERADVINAKAIQKTETFLIEKKSAMLHRHAEQAFAIAEKAKDRLLNEGFETSSSAVAALKWATEEERAARGMQGFLTELHKYSEDELLNRATNLIRRRSQAVDAEIVEEESTTKDSNG